MLPNDQSQVFKEAWQKAKALYEKMTPQQRKEKLDYFVRDAQYQHLSTNDGVDLLQKILAQKSFDIIRNEQQRALEIRARLNVQGKQVEDPKPVPLAQVQETADTTPATTQQPAVSSVFLQPGIEQLKSAHYCSPEELQARGVLAHGIQFDGARPVNVCSHHQEQITELRNLSEAPEGQKFKPSMSVSSAVFKESITSTTALLPMCETCCVIQGAALPVSDDGYQKVYQLQVLDTCTCASRIVDSDCWFCELGRMEAVKQVAVLDRTPKRVVGTPVNFDGHKELLCSCGVPVPIPEIARECVGCGGIQTTCFNFAGNYLRFHGASETIMEVDGHAVPSSSGLRVPSCIPQVPSAALIPPAQSRKRKAEHPVPAPPPGSKKVNNAKHPSNFYRVPKPAKGEVFLFVDTPEANVATQLRDKGLSIFMRTCKKTELTPLLRLETLLFDNKDHVFDNSSIGSILHILELCGFEKDTWMVLVTPAVETFGNFMTGAQVMEMMQKLDWPRCTEGVLTIGRTLTGGYQTPHTSVVQDAEPKTQETKRIAYNSVHTVNDMMVGCFSQADKDAFDVMGFYRRPDPELLTKLLTPGKRAKAMLKMNADPYLRLSTGRLARFLQLCGYGVEAAVRMSEQYAWGDGGSRFGSCENVLAFFEGEFDEL